MTDSKKTNEPKDVSPASELTDEELKGAVGGLILGTGATKAVGTINATVDKGPTFNTADGGAAFRTPAAGSFNTFDGASGIKNLGKLKR